MAKTSKGKFIIPVVMLVGILVIFVTWRARTNSSSRDVTTTQTASVEEMSTSALDVEQPAESSFTQTVVETIQFVNEAEENKDGEMALTQTTEASLEQTADVILAATETAVATEYAVQPTPRTEMEGTNPESVKLASGQPQLIEFFAFW